MVLGWVVHDAVLADGTPPRPSVHRREMDFPEAELHRGVAGLNVRFHTYGDDGGQSTFVEAWGHDRDETMAAFKRAVLLVQSNVFTIALCGEA